MYGKKQYLQWKSYIEFSVKALAKILQRILLFTELIEVVFLVFSDDFPIYFFSSVAYKVKSFCNYLLKLFWHCRSIALHNKINSFKYNKWCSKCSGEL